VPHSNPKTSSPQTNSQRGSKSRRVGSMRKRDDTERWRNLEEKLGCQRIELTMEGKLPRRPLSKSGCVPNPGDTITK